MTVISTTPYDVPEARHRAAQMLSACWHPIRRPAWVWTPFYDAADGCARNAARCLLRGETEAALEWAAAHRLLSDRVSRGHREAERRRERAEVVTA